MPEDDILDGADIGETRTVTNTEDIWLGQLEHEAASGTDRLSDRRLESAEVVTDELGDQHLRVTVESDVTKRLPHRWDYAQEPRTDSERQAKRRETWARRVARFGPVPITLGIVLGITHRIMGDLSSEVVLNGEPLSYSIWSLVPVATLVVLVTAIVLAIPYMPGGFGRGAL